MFTLKQFVTGCAACFAATVIIFASAIMAAEKQINLAATEYPPYYGKDLEGHGFMTDLIIEAFATVGYEVTGYDA